MMHKIEKIVKKFDVVVCGGGIGGVCAAIASARMGSNTVLIQNRPVLGGNASSEVRVHIGGATEHGYYYDARETGILEEIRLETAVRDPKNEYFWIDTVLYTFCKNEDHLSLYLNTNIFDVIIKDNQIQSVIGIQTGTERMIEFFGKIFIDSTGDGTIGYLAGADFRQGREGKDEFNEIMAPDKPDNYTLGSTIMFSARDMGHPIPYEPPDWAIIFTEEMLRYRKGYGKNENFKYYWHADSAGWWWVEYGGLLDTIKDNEEIRFHLQSIVYGIWDWIKNHDDKQKEIAKNFEISWISQIPGKRESRRLIGDYILVESDLVNMTTFPDQIAIGGWSMDLHPPEGFYAKTAGAEHLYPDLSYSIPFRSIYSRNISNLMIACRAISTSHVAHGSTRLIATIGCIGQAVGTAAHFCVKNNYTPRDLLKKDIEQLQQELLKNDQRLFGVENSDKHDLALKAIVKSNSEKKCEFGYPTKFINLFFPMAQRFYLPKSTNTDFKIWLYLKNESDKEAMVSGGIRMDASRFEFKSEEDLTRISAGIPPNYEGWIQLNCENNKFSFFESRNYWIYLDETENVSWGRNDEDHWNGFRMGYLNEENNQWQTVRINGNEFFDRVIGFYGTFCFKIDNINSPYPAEMINNGYNTPFVRPNLWISEPFRDKSLRDQKKIIKDTSVTTNIEVSIEFQKSEEISEIWLTFDTELNNSYPHQAYGSERKKDWPIGGKSPKCIRNLDIFMINELGKRILIAKITDNYQRRAKIILDKKVQAKKIIVKPLSNWGFKCFNLYELRIY